MNEIKINWPELFGRNDLGTIILVIAILAITALLIWGIIRKSQVLKQFASIPALANIGKNISPTKRNVKIVIFIAAIIFLGISLLRIQSDPVERTQQNAPGRDIAFILDISKSMLAIDRPGEESHLFSRIEIAKNAIIELVNCLSGVSGDCSVDPNTTNRLGLVVFAGNPILKIPLTSDLNFFVEQLRGVNVGDTSAPGTDIGKALHKVNQFLFNDNVKNKFRDIILITDADPGNTSLKSNKSDDFTLNVANKLRESGISIYAIGLGSPNGALIPIKRDDNGKIIEYQRDTESGERIRTKLHIDLIKQLGQSPGGWLSPGDNILNLVDFYKKKIQTKEKAEKNIGENKEWREWFQIPLIISLMLLVIHALISEKVQSRKIRIKSSINKLNIFRTLRK